MHHIEFRFAQDDFRPTMILDDVTDVTIEHAKLPHAARTPALVAREVSGLVVQNSPGIPDTRRAEKIAEERF